MKLKELTLGPIVGETTPHRTRIWGRGDAHIIENNPRRCFGAIRFRKSGTKQWQKHQIIKMNPNWKERLKSSGIPIRTGAAMYL